jgi:RHS repeat-associated protein
MISNPLNGSASDFVYDSGNRLVQTGSTTYDYDANDNRISQTSNGSKTQYVYDTTSSLSRMIMSTDANGNKTYYVYGVGLIGEQNSSNAYSVYHYDYRGSTTALTDISGTVTDTYTYDAYGKLLTHGTNTTPFLFNGRDGVMTDTTGLYYMRARYYSPELMRFINADTYKGNISNSSSLNNYAYANGNPISLVDPFGRCADSPKRIPDKTLDLTKMEFENTMKTKLWKHIPIWGQIQFYNAVRSGGDWDYKLAKKHPEWMPDDGKFSAFGVNMTDETLGNFNFGFTGASMGFNPSTLFAGGGWAAIQTQASWEDWQTYFDSSTDHKWVGLGIVAYSAFDPIYRIQISPVLEALEHTDATILLAIDKAFKK